jgi:NADH-quinone oxidoreductase subunit J
VTLVAVTALANASAWAVYAVGAALVIGGAAGVVLGRNPVHCALALVTTIFGIALLFINQGADFLAAVQIIVYAGAIVILFLFVIMLLGVDRKEAREPQKLRALTPVAVVVGVVALIELLVLARVHYWATGAKEVSGSLSGPGTNVQKLGQSIFTGYLLPFEMTSALLVIAVVAAVVLVRRAQSGPRTGPQRRAQTAPLGPGRRPDGGQAAPSGRVSASQSPAGQSPASQAPAAQPASAQSTATQTTATQTTATQTTATQTPGSPSSAAQVPATGAQQTQEDRQTETTKR